MLGWDRAVKEFLAYKAAVCREATAPAYEWSLTAFQKLMAPKALRHIDVSVLRDFAAARCKTCAAATTNKDLRAAAGASALGGVQALHQGGAEVPRGLGPGGRAGSGQCARGRIRRVDYEIDLGQADD